MADEIVVNYDEFEGHYVLRTSSETEQKFFGSQLPSLVETLCTDLLPSASSSAPSPPTLDSFEGCLVGIALGDMIGLASEGFAPDVCTEYVARLSAEGGMASIMEPWEMRVEVAKAQRGWEGTPAFKLGQISDDTQCARELALSIVESDGFSVESFAARLAALHGGEPVPDILGRMLETGVIGQGATSKYSLDRLAEGYSWIYAGAGAPRLSNGSVMRVGPLGLLNWADPGAPTSWAAGCLSSYLSHPQPLCMEAGAAMATVVSIAAACAGDASGVVQQSLAALGAQTHVIDWSAMIEAMLACGLDHDAAQTAMLGYTEASYPLPVRNRLRLHLLPAPRIFHTQQFEPCETKSNAPGCDHLHCVL